MKKSHLYFTACLVITVESQGLLQLLTLLYLKKNCGSKLETSFNCLLTVDIISTQEASTRHRFKLLQRKVKQRRVMYGVKKDSKRLMIINDALIF